MCRMNERTNEQMNLQAIFQSEMSTTVKTSRNKLTLVYAIFGSFLIFQTLNKHCCFVCFILRQMISWCWVCVFEPSHRPSRLGSHVKIYLDLTFPPKRVSGIMRAEDFAELYLKRKIFFPSFLYNELINIAKVERYRLFNSWKVSSNGNKYYQASMIS